MNSQIAIELKNVSKSFRIHHERKNSLFEFLTSIHKRNTMTEELQVLKNLSLTIKKGELVGILGFNGSGKTTLLKIISEIYKPNNGDVLVHGKVIPILGLGIGFNPQLTARDNVIIYGMILGFSKKEITDKIANIAKFAELENFLDTKIKNFSSGMIARIAFSTALQVDPDILIVDEVLSVGDIKFREKSFNAFMEFKKKGKTILFVSHSLGQIAKICDKVMWLHDGIIRKEGLPANVINEYTLFSNLKKHPT